MAIDPGMQSQALPQAAHERLADLEQRAAAGHLLATTDLTVDEFLLLQSAGFEPVGMVVGSSVYHVGYQRGSWSQNQELTTLTQAMYNARELALSRLAAEAQALGASGVVGVQLRIQFLEWGEDIGEFTAVGTAVRQREGQDWRADGGIPFTSDLSGQAFYKLIMSGWRPLGLVVGNCVYHVAHQSFRQLMKQMGQNVEVALATQALYEARELAMGRMQAEAERLNASMVVETRLEVSSHIWEHHIMEFLSVGTAIRPVTGELRQLQAQLVLSMDGG
jgi:uncharacterized protein YbjQ (UPF0145 family)